MAMPSGLRSQTPINHTESKPGLAMASHSAEGTELKSMVEPYLWLRPESQTQVLISYNVGYRGQADKVITSFSAPTPFVSRQVVDFTDTANGNTAVAISWFRPS